MAAFCAQHFDHLSIPASVGGEYRRPAGIHLSIRVGTVLHGQAHHFSVPCENREVQDATFIIAGG
jgi:hypothetical protein